MTIRKFFISTAAVFGVMYAMDFLWHGFLLEGTYKETSKLWRSESEIMNLISLCIISHLVISLFTVSLFKNSIFSNKRDINLKNSLLAGLTLGAIVGVIEMSSYIYMPIPFSLALAWFTNRIIQGLAIGAVLYLLNKPEPRKGRRSNNRGPRKSSNSTARRTTAKTGAKPVARRKKPTAVA